jgi:hypothetical protein
MRTAARPATLEPVRFGEFLLERSLITDEQWLSALAEHWSNLVAASGSGHVRIGSQIVRCGYLAKETVEAEARAFHTGAGLDGVEVDETDYESVEVQVPRSERTTLPVPQVRFVAPPI